MVAESVQEGIEKAPNLSIGRELGGARWPNRASRARFLFAKSRTGEGGGERVLQKGKKGKEKVTG